MAGGWDPETMVIHREINAQIDQAFRNVDLTLRTAGGKGWEQVSADERRERLLPLSKLFRT